MENFIVSARKYRPSTFGSVVGQKSLVTTLKNAIKSNHLAHAYLFCGPRGVGKTTCARIFAKTINCEHLTSDFEACNECESCVSFNEQRSLNIHELDAASNNSTDDIKYLIEQVRIPPQIGKYSVYIVDEVHMLSAAAFNAFLKTLEEPPAHAIFILATTEKHKIIPTILSRCQIYDFNRITIADTVAHLQYVAQKEGVTVDVNGLNVIAQKSDGGMRDALSIFDQLVSFCGNNISYQGVIDNLNVLDYDYYFRLVDKFLNNDVSGSLLILNEIINKGFDPHHFVTGLSTHLRDVMVSKDAQTVQLLELGDEIGEKYKKQAAVCPVEFLYGALKLANDCDLSYRISNNKRLLVELMLVRICQLTDEKKKEFLTNDDPIPLKKIEIDAPIAVPASQQVAEKQIIEPEKPNTPPASPEKAEPEKKRIPVINKPASISISIEKEKENASEPMVSYPEAKEPLIPQNQPLTINALLSEWKKISAILPEENRLIVENNEPVLVSENVFEISVNNIMQEREIKRFETDIIGQLRSALRNSKISMRIKVEEVITERKITDPEELYRKMVDENPQVSKLRSGLKLEFD